MTGAPSCISAGAGMMCVWTGRLLIAAGWITAGAGMTLPGLLSERQFLDALFNGVQLADLADDHVWPANYVQFAP